MRRDQVSQTIGYRSDGSRTTRPGTLAVQYGQTVIMRVAVFVERWEHECCGAEFRLGDEVTWLLVVDRGWRRKQLGAHAPAQAVDLSVGQVIEPDGTEQGASYSRVMACTRS